MNVDYYNLKKKNDVIKRNKPNIFLSIATENHFDILSLVAILLFEALISNLKQLGKHTINI